MSIRCIKTVQLIHIKPCSTKNNLNNYFQKNNFNLYDLHWKNKFTYICIYKYILRYIYIYMFKGLYIYIYIISLLIEERQKIWYSFFQQTDIYTICSFYTWKNATKQTPQKVTSFEPNSGRRCSPLWWTLPVCWIWLWIPVSESTLVFGDGDFFSVTSCCFNGDVSTGES